jgi:hypothetical protein
MPAALIHHSGSAEIGFAIVRAFLFGLRNAFGSAERVFVDLGLMIVAVLQILKLGTVFA